MIMSLHLTKQQGSLLVLSKKVIDRISKYSDCIEFCGPISTGGFGNAVENIECLQSFIHEAQKKGLHIFDQLAFEKEINEILGPVKGYDYDLLEYFYKPILESGYIKKLIFIPGWQQSYGSCWEMEIGKQNNIEIIILEDYTLRTCIGKF